MRHNQQFFEVTDIDGARHILRIADIQSVADTDLMRNESVIVVRDQPIIVQTPLDQLRTLLLPARQRTLH